MMEKKELISKFDKIFTAWGFKRKNTSWSKIEKDCVLLLVLRKNRWREHYFFEIDMSFQKDLNGSFFINPKNIDFSVAANRLIPDLDTEMLDRALDLEISNDENLNKLIVFLMNRLPQYLSKISNITEFREMYEQGLLKGAAIAPFARKVMNIPW